jgi:Fe-S-cluster containining protein
MNEYNKSEVGFFFTALKEEARTAIWQVRSNADPETLVNSVLDDLQALAPRANDERTEEEIWTQIRERLVKAAYATRPHCVRCGTCCLKGSPVLVGADLDLFNRDILKPQHVITIRRSEDAYSERSQKAEPSDHEYLKIKERPDSKTCIFFSKLNNECAIYEARPQQCKTQECWNPEASSREEDSWIERKTLLEATGPLWDIIRRHEEKCSHFELKRALGRLSATKGQTVEEILEILRFDHYVREWVCETFGLKAETLEFFFGRPLKDTLFLYGLSLEEREDGSFFLSVTPE